MCYLTGVTDRPAKRPTYWILLVPLLLGMGTCGGSLYATNAKVKAMPRMKVPGEATLELSKGSHTGFLEENSIVDGESISGVPSVTCSAKTAAGDKLALGSPSASTSYSFGSFSGESAMTLDVPEDGAYTITCTGSGSGALAFGSGIGWLIVIAVVGGLLGVVIAGILWWRVRKKRKAFDAAPPVPTATALS